MTLPNQIGSKLYAHGNSPYDDLVLPDGFIKNATDDLLRSMHNNRNISPYEAYKDYKANVLGCEGDVLTKDALTALAYLVRAIERSPDRYFRKWEHPLLPLARKDIFEQANLSEPSLFCFDLLNGLKLPKDSFARLRFLEVYLKHISKQPDASRQAFAYINILYMGAAVSRAPKMANHEYRCQYLIGDAVLNIRKIAPVLDAELRKYALLEAWLFAPRALKGKAPNDFSPISDDENYSYERIVWKADLKNAQKEATDRKAQRDLYEFVKREKPVESKDGISTYTLKLDR